MVRVKVNRERGFDSENDEPLRVSRIRISCRKPKISMNYRLRIYEKHQNYRYAKKPQISLDLKKYRYVGTAASI
jgi:hypothetical protein